MEWKVDPKYFDYAASTPPWPKAVDAFTEASLKGYANPSSIHQQGRSAKQLMLELKKEFYDLLNFNDGRLLLTSSGSEANNTIIEGHLKKYPEGRILMATDVHESIWYTNKKYPEHIKIFKIESDGHYDVKRFESALKNDITLVCINHACNETGAIQPVEKIADLCYQKQVKLLIDGMQTIGHIPLNLDEIPFSYYTISGHKFGSVKGVGGILMRDGEFDPLIYGGKQEWERRAGTENVAGLASMVAALKKSLVLLEDENERLRRLKDHMIQKIITIRTALINSHDPDLPGLLSVSFPWIFRKRNCRSNGHIRVCRINRICLSCQ
jgi:cysteine desulfurase